MAARLSLYSAGSPTHAAFTFLSIGGGAHTCLRQPCRRALPHKRPQGGSLTTEPCSQPACPPDRLPLLTAAGLQEGSAAIGAAPGHMLHAATSLLLLHAAACAPLAPHPHSFFSLAKPSCRCTTRRAWPSHRPSPCPPCLAASACCAASCCGTGSTSCMGTRWAVPACLGHGRWQCISEAIA